jgi:hypothetical protein
VALLGRGRVPGAHRTWRLSAARACGLAATAWLTRRCGRRFLDARSGARLAELPSLLRFRGTLGLDADGLAAIALLAGQGGAVAVMLGALHPMLLTLLLALFLSVVRVGQDAFLGPLWEVRAAGGRAARCVALHFAWGVGTFG